MFATTRSLVAARAFSFTLAAIVTLGVLGGVDRLAVPSAAEQLAMHVDESAEQVVTVTAGRHSAQS
jgi:hypothetical protein